MSLLSRGTKPRRRPSNILLKRNHVVRMDYEHFRPCGVTVESVKRLLLRPALLIVAAIVTRPHHPRNGFEISSCEQFELIFRRNSSYLKRRIIDISCARALELTIDVSHLLRSDGDTACLSIFASSVLWLLYIVKRRGVLINC